VSLSKPRESPDSILVVRLGAIGDVVRTLPAVSCLRRSYPQARISWAVEEPSSSLLQGHPDVDEVLVLERRVLRKALSPLGAIRALRHLRKYAALLRERRFDWSIDLQGTLKSALLSRASGAARTYGLGPGHAREWSHLLYSEPVPLPRGRMNRVDRALAVAEALGADVSSPRRHLPVREEPAAAARSFLEASAPRRPRVLVYPGTSEAQAFKRIPADSLARAADELAEGTGASIIVGWGPGEELIAGEVLGAMKRTAVLAPRTLLPELVEIMRECDLFVGSDTGPLHIAAAAGIPIIALYGPTDPAVNAPYTDRPYEYLVGDVRCRPCRNRGCLNRSCLRLIDPSEVARRAMALLGADRAGRIDEAPAIP
jgi:lipopolysaccharide heptosyltransferase I